MKTGSETSALLVPRERLVPARWNYKHPGTDEEIQRLADSIRLDGSAGVLPVRHLDGDRLEVIDGNHRLRAIDLLGWEVVPVEDFGHVPLGEAVLLAYRRNKAWFPDDEAALGLLLREVVLPAIGREALAAAMPERIAAAEIDLADRLAPYEWPDTPPEEPVEGELSSISISGDEDLAQAWSDFAAGRGDDVAFSELMLEVAGQ